MIKNYKEFALHVEHWDNYLSQEEIDNFNKIYENENIPKEERTIYFEELEEEFNKYLDSLDSKELIEFMDWIIKLILKKDYMNNYEKAHKIYDVICNGLFWYIEEVKDRFNNINIIKDYFYNLWNFVIKLNVNDRYLLENKEYFKKNIDKL